MSDARQSSIQSDVPLLRQTSSMSDSTASPAVSRSTSVDEDSRKSSAVTAASVELAGCGNASGGGDNLGGTGSCPAMRSAEDRGLAQHRQVSKTKVLFDRNKLPSRLAEEEDDIRPTMEQESCAEAYPNIPPRVVTNPLSSGGKVLFSAPLHLQRQSASAAEPGTSDGEQEPEARRHSWLGKKSQSVVLFSTEKTEEEAASTGICPRTSLRMSQRKSRARSNAMSKAREERTASKSFQMNLQRADGDSAGVSKEDGTIPDADDPRFNLQRNSSRTLFQVEAESSFRQAVLVAPGQNAETSESEMERQAPAEEGGQDRRVLQRKSSRTLFQLDDQMVTSDSPLPGSDLRVPNEQGGAEDEPSAQRKRSHTLFDITYDKTKGARHSPASQEVPVEA